MAKRKSTSANPTVNIVDQSIQVRAVNRTPQSLDKWKNALTAAESIVQPARVLLYDLYASVLLDDHLISVVEKRRRAISRAAITFQIDGEPVEAMSVLIGKRCFQKLLVYMLDARLFGYSLIQADLTNLCTDLVPRAHVIPSRTLVVNSPYDQEGIDYTQPPYNRFYLGVGEPDDLGLLFPAAYCVLLKRNTIIDWAGFNEMYGQPIRIGYYDPMDPGQKPQLETGLESMGKAAWAALPKGAEIDLKEANKTAAKDTYDGFATRQDKAISKILIGQTMTTDDGSSKSQAEVHERVADEIVMDDLKYVISYLNEHLKPILLAQGFPVGEGDFVVIEEEAKLSKKDRLDMDLKIHKEVAPLKLDYFELEYNVPIDQEALAKRQAQAEAASQQPDPDEDKRPNPKDKPVPAKKKLAADSPFSTRGLLNLLGDFFAQAPTR